MLAECRRPHLRDPHMHLVRFLCSRWRVLYFGRIQNIFFAIVVFPFCVLKTSSRIRRAVIITTGSHFRQKLF